MSYNLFLDDVRFPNAFLKDIRTWVISRNYNEFVNTIKEKDLPQLISFDHDLHWEHYPIFEKDGGISNPTKVPYDTYKEKTGYDAAKWLIEYCENNNLNFPEYQVHSMNPIGKQNIISLIESYKKSKS